MPYKSIADLPAQTASLPPAAKKIFMAAFNASLDEYGEKRSHQIAWAAVKQKFEKQGNSWAAKDSRATTDEIELEETMVLDAASVRYTKDGYMIASPRIARAGIQQYSGLEMGRDDMKVVRVYRPEGEVFHVDSLQSGAYKPVTLDHPPEMVNAQNWRKYAVGQLGGDIARDGDAIRVPMMISDQEAIDAIIRGKAELSAGYAARVEWTAGETAQGEKYDAVQKSIRINHVAVVDVARGGPLLKIGDEGRRNEPERSRSMQVLDVNGIRLELEDKDASILNAHLRTLNDQIAKITDEAAKARAIVDEQIAKLTTQVTEATNTIKARDAEIVTLKKQLEDSQITPQKLQDAARAWAGTVHTATALLGDKLVVDGKSEIEIMRQVVDSELKDGAKGWTDDQVRVSFATIAARAKTSSDQVAASFASAGARTVDAAGPSNAEYLKMVDRLGNSWRKPQPAA